MYRILYTAIKNSTGRGDQNVQRLHVDADVKMARKKKKKQNFMAPNVSMYVCLPGPRRVSKIESKKREREKQKQKSRSGGGGAVEVTWPG
jgi:hypothetical protein